MLFFLILLFVQVVVESLPVSSSAHVWLVQNYMSCMRLNEHARLIAHKNSADIDIIVHLMHLPTVLIILFFFRDRIFFLLQSLQRSWLIVAKIVLLTVLADSVTVFFFFLFKKFPLPFPVGLGLIITALILYSLRWVKTSNAIWDWRYALLIGGVQGIALLPGISRFATVYACASWLGLPQHKAFEITWLVQLPLILAACAESAYLVWGSDQLAFLYEPLSMVMLGIATICGLGALYMAAYMARVGRLWCLSFYMVVPILLWFYLVYSSCSY
jgi:undecaprenyl-diphosphatase